METSTIIKRAQILNYIEIFITLALFILFTIVNRLIANASSEAEFYKYVIIEKTALRIMSITSIVVIILTAMMIKNNMKRVKGLGCLMAAGIITFIFSIIGISLGIIIWALCATSLKSLAEKSSEDSFDAYLNSEMSGNTTESEENKEI